MAKDEVTRQIEEMQKYLKEQEELNKPAVVNTANENTPADKDSAEKVIEPEIVDGPVNKNKQFGTQKDKKGCGCGCFSFIIFIIFASIVLSFIRGLFRMLPH